MGVLQFPIRIHLRPVASGDWGAQAPKFLADQLTLSQPGGAHSPHPVLRAPPDFQTLRRPCIVVTFKQIWKNSLLECKSVE